MSQTIPTPENPGSVHEVKDRRVRKSQRALRDAFIALVLERGYDDVTVEDIAERADVARATFYAHFADKEQLLTTLFEEMTADVALSLTNVTGAPEGIRIDIAYGLYAHAAQYRDLYLVCLRGAGNGRGRAAYQNVLATRAEVVFAERLRVSGRQPGAPLRILGLAWAAMRVTLIENWLEEGDLTNIEQVVRGHMSLASKGFAWALGMLPDEMTTMFPEI